MVQGFKTSWRDAGERGIPVIKGEVHALQAVIAAIFQMLSYRLGSPESFKCRAFNYQIKEDYSSAGFLDLRVTVDPLPRSIWKGHSICLQLNGHWGQVYGLIGLPVYADPCYHVFPLRFSECNSGIFFELPDENCLSEGVKSSVEYKEFVRGAPRFREFMVHS